MQRRGNQRLEDINNAFFSNQVHDAQPVRVCTDVCTPTQAKGDEFQTPRGEDGQP